MVTFTAPLVAVLVVMLVSCERFSKSCSRSSSRSLAVPPLAWAVVICEFNVAICDSSELAELTSLPSDAFNCVFSVPRWLLIWLKVVDRFCAALMTASSRKARC